MKNECSIVYDLLPLYLENLVSEDTEQFIKNHLASCSKCALELETMKTGEQIENVKHVQDEAEDLKVMQVIHKKIRRDVHRKDLMKTLIVAILCFLIYCFPVYRMFTLVPFVADKYYTNEEIAKALYVGDPVSRMQARSVIRLAKQSFEDIRHTDEENKERYGLLARYATDVDSYEGAAESKYSLKLWSAHLGEKNGVLWVYYSAEVYDAEGNIICGSWKVPALWEVEKNEYGEWVVVNIVEHP